MKRLLIAAILLAACGAGWKAITKTQEPQPAEHMLKTAAAVTQPSCPSSYVCVEYGAWQAPAGVPEGTEYQYLYAAYGPEVEIGRCTIVAGTCGTVSFTLPKNANGNYAIITHRVGMPDSSRMVTLIKYPFVVQ